MKKCALKKKCTYLSGWIIINYFLSFLCYPKVRNKDYSKKNYKRFYTRFYKDVLENQLYFWKTIDNNKDGRKWLNTACHAR